MAIWVKFLSTAVSDQWLQNQPGHPSVPCHSCWLFSFSRMGGAHLNCVFGYTAPPNGVVYDTPQDIVKMKNKIMQRAVITKTMPQNNKTNITPEERNLLRCRIDQGASIK